MKKHFTIRVSGLVQGVFFRASTKAKAAEFGVTGFVRNEPDGSVYIEAEGEEENLEKFLQWCRKGPANASVENCETIEKPLKGFSAFAIQR